MADSDRKSQPQGVVLVDALWKYCPAEWRSWTREYFYRPPPEVLRGTDQKAYVAWPVIYPSKPPDGPPSTWAWLSGDAKGLWHMYPTMRQPSQAAIPSGDSLRGIWLAFRFLLQEGGLRASGFRDGSLQREEIPPEAWERLEWDLDVQASRVSASGARFEAVRIRERATAGVDSEKETPIPEKSGAPGRPTSMRLVEAEFGVRAERKSVEPSLGEQARVLAEWLRTAHPLAPRLTPKTIENRLRHTYKRARAESGDGVGGEQKPPK